jgi:hypothetical protein
MLSSSGILSLKRKSLLKRKLRRKMRKMTREDIVEFTRQAGGFDATPEFLERFAALVAAASEAKEREACAKVCDEFESDTDPDAGAVLAAAIRERSANARARGQA